MNGVFLSDGTFRQLAEVDTDTTNNLWRRKVFDLLSSGGKIDRDTVGHIVGTATAAAPAACEPNTPPRRRSRSTAPKPAASRREPSTAFGAAPRLRRNRRPKVSPVVGGLRPTRWLGQGDRQATENDRRPPFSSSIFPTPFQPLPFVENDRTISVVERQEFPTLPP
jgi:hypothetical protein